MMQAGIAEKPAVLTSWKEIARYMGKGVRTVQRWEQDFGLPVRRPMGSDKKAVLARPGDLDNWVALRCGTRPNGYSNGDAARGSMAIRCNMAAEMETRRRLRDDNRQIRGELQSALAALREHIAVLYKKSA